MRGLFVWPNDQTVLLSVDQVVGGHRQMVEVETEGVVDERKVEDPTMTSTNETWWARMTNNSSKGYTICFTLSLDSILSMWLGLEPAARFWATREKILRVQSVRVTVHCLHSPSLTMVSLVSVSDTFQIKTKSALTSLAILWMTTVSWKMTTRNWKIGTN